MNRRASGVLLPVYALPSPHGIGTLGRAAYDFADFLHAAGQRCWQMLPLGQTGFGDSPYQSFSSFAGNPYFIDLDLLAEDGLLTGDEADTCCAGVDPRYVDYGRLYTERFAVLDIPSRSLAGALSPPHRAGLCRRRSRLRRGFCAASVILYLSAVSVF